MTERPLDTKAIAEITGFTTRWVREKAAAGKIPGAIQVEAGSDWRFDRKKFLKWWNSKERAPSPSAYEIRSRGSASSGRARPPADVLEQAVAASKKRLKEGAARERLKWGPRK